MRAKGSREAITWEYVTDASEGEEGGQMVAKGNFRRLIPWALPEHSRKHCLNISSSHYNRCQNLLRIFDELINLTFSYF